MFPVIHVEENFSFFDVFFAAERGVSAEEDVEDDTAGPDVDFVVMGGGYYVTE